MMLIVEKLSKSYGKNMIFDNLSFNVHPGEIVGLVGENGAGKSTLLSILAMVQKADAGTITLNHQCYQTDKKELRRQIGFVPQDLAIWEQLSVKENMQFFAQLSWVKKDMAELKELCLQMQLEKWDEPVKSLSGGMKRKLNIAISLIHDPHLLLLDEPTAGIDLKSRTEIGRYLKQLASQGKMIIYTSHDMDELRSLCDRVLCIGKDPFYKNIFHESPIPFLAIPD